MGWSPFFARLQLQTIRGATTWPRRTGQRPRRPQVDSFAGPPCPFENPRSTAGAPRVPRFPIPMPKENPMSHYVDGFVLPVPINKLDDYRRLAETAGKVWIEYGALQYWECVGDDVSPGKVTSFPQSVQLKEGETVVFSWILYESREQRDIINAKVMADPRIKDSMDPKTLPFDGMRMFWGGFKTLVEL
jgi:uncharacterized protein YbaA (DUF1428 family)